ncbi:MAG TPA: response regulator, partial [Acidimicrobiales bacterium]|nr:response regulator [Acidimicrobiales bacterium]
MTARVLAAEDSPTQAAFLIDCLESEGFEVMLAANGADALALASTEAFDVVVSDVVMPEMGGYDLCRAVKASRPDLPVILLTGLDDPLDVIDALDAGADNFVRKPYQAAELVERVHSVLRTRELRAASDAADGLELSFRGKRFTISSDREQMLGLLVGTFEDLVSTNQQLRDHEAELARANEEIAARLSETETERERLHGVLGAVPQAMAIVDRVGVIVEINDNLARLLGQDADSLRGTSVWDAVQLVDHSGRPLAMEQRALTESLTEGRPASRGGGFDVFLKAPDGGSRPVISRTAPVFDRAGNVLGAVGTIEDIGQLQLYDPVTGLPGHGILIDRLQSAIDDATRDRNRAGVLVVAIDRFDVLRSSLSPSESAVLIGGIADELEDLLSADEVLQRSTGASVGYLGNAEFAVVLPAADSEADVIFVGEFLSERLSRTADIDGLEVPVTVSVAVGVSQGDDEPAALLSAAAASVRQRREAGAGGVITSDAALHATVVAQLQRESELRRAITEGEIVVHYQPQVQLRGGAPVGVEALVRWQHPERGLLGA